ncbi:MAG TPA: T9SS type A sorting domain-containing protein [Ignavibacteria bacterium]|nr:T9SS type A sorting domain-containing protein [Ignavibacteria bacterium]
MIINGANGCGLYVWTLPGVAFSNEHFPWPMYGHDRYRTNQFGFIPPDEPVGIQSTSTIVPEKFSLHQNYPNPFNPATTIKFDIRNSAFTKLTVFDILGREIQNLVNEELKTGSYSLVFDGNKYNSGVYFYRLASGDFTETKRMMLLK